MTSKWQTQHKCGNPSPEGYHIGCQKWKQKKNRIYQKYCGRFLYNNLHNRGIYTIHQKNDKLYMDGLFYANKLEGYGQIVYSNGISFEGLFKQHERFGPGISTHPDGTQDVGLWQGFTLMRLSTQIGVNFVPQLATTSQGQAFLLKYRHLVPIYEKPKDKAKDLMESLGAPQHLIDNASVLYNRNVRNPSSQFFDKNSFDLGYFGEEDDCVIEIIENVDNSAEEQTQVEEYGEDGSNFSHIFQYRLEQNDCDCYVEDDYIAQLCVQMAEVDNNILRLITRKRQMEDEYAKDKPSDTFPSKTKCISAKSETNFFSSETVLNSTMYSSTPAPMGQNLHKSAEQLQLNNMDSVSAKKSLDVSMSDDEQLSTITLPFEVTRGSVSLSMGSNIKLPAETFNPSITGLAMEGSVAHLGSSSPTGALCSSKMKRILADITFYRAIKANLKARIDKEFATAYQERKIDKEEEEEGKETVKKVQVTDLLAWNNEQIWVEMLQHCFKHRKSQNFVTFNVTDILAGQRRHFKDAGVLETVCRRFLMMCLEGHEHDAFGLLKLHSLNPDLCDARGNTGIMLATVTDHVNIIDMLVNLGGKVDVVNDEGITPLVMALLRYIMLTKEIGDWEKAFLREPKLRPQDLIGLKEWCPNKFLLRCKSPSDSWTHGDFVPYLRPHESINFLEQTRKSATEIYFHSSTILPKVDRGVFTKIEENLLKIEGTANYCMPVDFFKNHHQDYVFNTDFVHVPKKIEKKKKKDKKKGKKNKKKKSQKSVKSLKKSKKSTTKTTKSKRSVSIFSAETKSMRSRKTIKDEEQEERDKLILRKIEEVKKTIKMLLTINANPNMGDVPMKPIFISLFTGTIEFLTLLLEHGADPNAINEDNATCLHFLAATQTNDILALEMAEILFRFKADPNIRTNCKHWPEVNLEIMAATSKDDSEVGKNPLHVLSLREDFQEYCEVLNGLVEIFLQNGCDPDGLYLGHTPLSLAIFRGNLKLINTLMFTKIINPYMQLGNGMGNALTLLFLRRCINNWTLEERKKIIDLLLKHLFNPLNPIGDDFDNVIHFLEVEKAKDVQFVVEKSKKNKKNDKKKKEKKKKNKKKKKKEKKNKGLDDIEKYVINETRKILLKHLQFHAIRYLYEFIMENIFWDPLVIALARFVNIEVAKTMLKLCFQYGLIDMSCFSYVVVGDVLEFIAIVNDENFDRETCDLILQEMSIQDLKRISVVYLPLPEMDENHAIYKVCFQCLQSRNRILKKCPTCEMVFFCSDKCNLAPNPVHKCTAPVYSKQDSVPDRLKLLLELAEKCRQERIHYFKLKELEDKLLEIKFKPVSLLRKLTQMQKSLTVLKKDRLQFARDHFLMDYSCANSFRAYSGQNLDTQPLSVENLNKIMTIGSGSKDTPSSGSFRFQKGPREKSEFPVSDTSSNPKKVIKLIPKLDGHFSKMPLFYTTKFQTYKSPVFAHVEEPKQRQSCELDKIVNKKYYMEMLSKVFADFNLPLILLPYACYKDGQIYYSMQDNMYFRKSFQKLNIPD